MPVLTSRTALGVALIGLACVIGVAAPLLFSDPPISLEVETATKETVMRRPTIAGVAVALALGSALLNGQLGPEERTNRVSVRIAWTTRTQCSSSVSCAELTR